MPVHWNILLQIDCSSVPTIGLILSAQQWRKFFRFKVSVIANTTYQFTSDTVELCNKLTKNSTIFTTFWHKYLNLFGTINLSKYPKCCKPFRSLFKLLQQNYVMLSVVWNAADVPHFNTSRTAIVAYDEGGSEKLITRALNFPASGNGNITNNIRIATGNTWNTSFFFLKETLRMYANESPNCKFRNIKFPERQHLATNQAQQRYSSSLWSHSYSPKRLQAKTETRRLETTTKTRLEDSRLSTRRRPCPNGRQIKAVFLSVITDNRGVTFRITLSSLQIDKSRISFGQAVMMGTSSLSGDR